MEPRLGDLLIASGKLSQNQLDRALRAQQETGDRLGTILVQLGFLAERDLAATISEQRGIPLATTDDFDLDPSLSDSLTPAFLRDSQAVPLREQNGRILVALTDPTDDFVVQSLRLALDQDIEPIVAVSTDIERALQKLFGQSEAREDTNDLEIDEFDQGMDDIEHLKDMASEAPIIRTVNQIIGRALEIKASDIHVEPFDGLLKIRYRVDGVLREGHAPSASSTAAIISRIKVMANLNIAERRLPQDGRIKLRTEGRELDMRISTIPTLHGESVVMRILDQGGVALDFDRLGFDGENLKRFQALLARPQGIILVTGPTGSGKTTTLYTALQELNTPERKILTVEDPVEYQLAGINQIQVQPKIDLTFANALRSILRQDPDVIMIGEMRDRETASIAVQSALTGHKVFSTLHTNDAPSSVTRLLDMQVEDYLLTSTLDCVLAQRLVRMLCPRCRQPYQPSAEWLHEAGMSHLTKDTPATLYHAGGCEHCDQSGYRGRIAILELLVITEQLRRTILEHPDADTIRAVAKREGMLGMREDGLRKALAGLTTMEEVERVTQDAIV